MWRKVIRKELPKSKIQEKQAEISRSVNLSETINESLKKDNSDILKEIDNKKIENEWLILVTKELVTKKNKAKKDFEKANTKLVELDKTILDIEDKNKEKLQAIKDLEEHYKEKSIEFITRANKEENEAINKINRLNATQDKLIKDNEKIKNENKVLKLDIKKQLDSILKNLDSIDKQEQDIKNITYEVNRIEKIYNSNIEKKEWIEKVINEITEEKQNKTKELNTVKKELDKTIIELLKSKEEIKTNKQINLVLIKREEVLIARETYIREYYQKAWLPINI